VTVKPNVAVSPKSEAQYLAAIALGGGVAADLDRDTNGLVWTDSSDSQGLLVALQSHPGIEWVQLPFAGVDNFSPVFEWAVESGREIRFTSAKGAYREPVAEHALMLALALARILPERIRAESWGRKYADTLFDSNVLIIGGGGIAEELIRLLAPFRCSITVVRRHVDLALGDASVLSLDSLDQALPLADFVFIASALTNETKGLFDDQRFELMKSSAYLINIARGGIVQSAALEKALRSGLIAGAGIDVTDPEPLPTNHSLWSVPNLIITPHTADTPEMCLRLLSARIVSNIENLIAGDPLIGSVNLKLGY
jgi:phosphoglycerate dehydrogenase-like enzyme